MCIYRELSSHLRGYKSYLASGTGKTAQLVRFLPVSMIPRNYRILVWLVWAFVFVFVLFCLRACRDRLIFGACWLVIQVNLMNSRPVRDREMTPEVVLTKTHVLTTPPLPTTPATTPSPPHPKKEIWFLLRWFNDRLFFFSLRKLALRDQRNG